jgi:hypothetical protein
MSTTGFQSPPDKALNCRKNVTPNPDSSHLQGKTTTNGATIE